jgi:FkbM family methyltransferase
MIRKLRVWFVGELIKLNEKWIFNRRLLKFYKSKLNRKINYVIDVGANSGQSIEMFLGMNPNCRIMAFEPNPRLAQDLCLKYADNPNIQSFQLGISDAAGQKTFHENVFDATSTFEELELTSEYLKFKSMILGVKPAEIVVSSYPVEVTTLAEVINSQCTGPIDILKIDTEGHEYACLAGLFNSPLKHKVDFIQLEIHFDDMYVDGKTLEQITEILNANDYCLEGKVKHGFGNFEDVVFRRNNCV